ncbi:hypothetical protein PDE_02399 [Penicillium oxalicum 114-2]|uniref:Rhodopsin domain-containing protein n=1 Tax=Penicillium oxalicum (strain 114-2 / CGMCC 5302) TaxID=933388 RepID=S7ZFM5_PENO1|nr:hypothetical protein PDE_02399 [Penicillium oxalicum 114-2]
MTDQKAPFQTISSDNHGAIITLISVSFAIAATIFVLAKLASTIYFKQRRTAVNTPVWIALVLAIVQVITLQKAIHHGLGRHQSVLDEGDIQKWSQFAFVSHILFVLVMCLSKISNILLVWKLTPSTKLRRNCVASAVLVGGWSVFAILSIAFQCKMPDPWVYSPERCAGKGAMFYPIETLNILTEAIIAAQPFLMMQNVQMARSKRVKILCAFSSRLSVLGLGIAHIVLVPSFIHSEDLSWDMANWEIVGQMMMLTSIIAACVPTLYHIFAGLHSGLTTTQIPDSIELDTTQTKAQNSLAGHSVKPPKESYSRSESRQTTRSSGWRSVWNGWGEETGVTTEISSRSSRGLKYHGRGGSRSNLSETEETDSVRGLTQGFEDKGAVLRTVDVTVEFEGREPPRGGKQNENLYF